MKFFFLSVIVGTISALLSEGELLGNAGEELPKRASAAMHQAATYFRTKVSVHGGYVYHYSLDLQQRWGEGIASSEQIWVQPPGTPTVGMAFLRAYEATGDQFYLAAATEAAEAIVYGQLQSGGWTNSIDFNPNGRVALYRNGNGRGKNNSSLDDGQTQSAIRLLIQVDAALKFKHQKIHQSVEVALNALLHAQYPNGGFPQVWTGPVAKQPVVNASYPSYPWQTEGRIKNYWNMYTLNDNVCGYVADTLTNAYQIYGDKRYKIALERLGDFLLLAQMPEPQPGWAQQYNYRMQPIWARKFEPPALAGDESQEAIETLMKIYRLTNNSKYLKPIPSSLAYLKRSLLADGRLARYYELKTNKPLYMVRRGRQYHLTYNDSRLPKHYGWKIDSRLNELEQGYLQLKSGTLQTTTRQPANILEQQVQKILSQLDDQGRWVSFYRGERLVGQPQFKLNTPYIASEVFSRNMEILSEYLTSTP